MSAYKLLVAAATLAIATLIASPASAAERSEACVKYKKQTGWSKGYAVEAIVIDGYDLREKTGDYGRFNLLSTYAVIFWDEGEATILELPALLAGSLPFFESEVRDQEGRLWNIKEGHLFCY